MVRVDERRSRPDVWGMVVLLLVIAACLLFGAAVVRSALGAILSGIGALIGLAIAANQMQWDAVNVLILGGAVVVACIAAGWKRRT